MPNKKLNILPAEQGEQPSRFVVDLKKKSTVMPMEHPAKPPLKKRGLTEKVVEFDLGKFWPKVRTRVKSFAFNFFKKLSSKTTILEAGEQCVKYILNKNNYGAAVVGNDSGRSLFSLIKKWYEARQKKLDQLAFFNLLKLFIVFLFKIFRLLYKLCYAIGWLAVFITRLAWLISLALVRAVSPLAKKQAINIKNLALHIARNLDKLIHYVFIKFIKRAKITRRSAEQKLSRYKEASFEAIESAKESFKKPAEVKDLPGKVLPQFHTGLVKSALMFALILMVLILPFKAYTYYKSISGLSGSILGISEGAVNDLFFASKSAVQLNFNQANQNFSDAANSFLAAQNKLGEVNSLLFKLASIVPSEDMRLVASSKNILAAGQEAANLGSNFSLALNSLFNNEGHDILEVIDNFTIYGSQAVANARNLSLQLNEIDYEILPAEYQEQFLYLKTKSVALKQGLVEFISLADKLKSFLGINQDKRYLLIFQNNTELRASGGFIGSYALVDFRDGRIKNLEVPGGGSYDTEGGLRELVIAPEPLHLVNPLWHFWDANWWPDWPTSARKLMWFYERSDGPTVDGVIGFTPTVLERILKVIGPVDMNDDYGVVINSENFWITVQRIVEQKPDITNTPKKIIGDLMNKIIEDLPARLGKDNLINLISLIEKSLAEKHILFYFTNSELQEKIEGYGWDGKTKQATYDYLSVINTNIAGGKSDRKIKETINLNTEIMPDGSIINTLEIERLHSGIKFEPFCGVRNVDWMRIYLPQGSELLEADGFTKPAEIYFSAPDSSWQNDPDLYQEEKMAKIHQPSGTKIYNEKGKTVFANWSMVDPGKTIKIYLKYKLPFKLIAREAGSKSLVDKAIKLLSPEQSQLYPYSILIQKQPGSQPSQINYDLEIADKFKNIWQYPKDFYEANNSIEINDELNIDKYWAILLESKK